MTHTNQTPQWMKRQMTLLLLAALGFMAFCIVSTSAHAAPILRHNNVISGAQITLGDIFSGLSEHQGNKVLGAAPRPGDDMVLNARTLLRIAMATDVDWRPSSNADYIVLSSAATLISREMVEDKIKAGLRDRGISGEFDLTFSNDSRSEIVLPKDVEKNVAVQDLSINRNRDWFDAVLVAPSLDNPIQRIKVSGRIEAMVSLPVLSTNLRNGDVIGSNDIETIEVPARNVNHDYILDTKDLVGMTPRRMIMQGKPVRSSDLRPPLLVERGKNVTMIFEDNGLRLTAMGRALQNGARGETIRVVNDASSRTVDAEITGAQEVTVKRF